MALGKLHKIFAALQLQRPVAHFIVHKHRVNPCPPVSDGLDDTALKVFLLQELSPS